MRERIYALLNFGGREIISQDDFEAIISPMAVFSAADINNSNELDIRDLKILLWLFEGKEPSPLRVQQEMKIIDADNSGTMDRMEFIKYLVSGSTDEDSFFDYELRKKFDSFDSDKNGTISMQELIAYLRGELRPYIMTVPSKHEHKVPEALHGLAKECVELLLEHDGRKGHNVTEKTEVPWHLFKNINILCKKKIDYMGGFIEHYLSQNDVTFSNYMQRQQ